MAVLLLATLLAAFVSAECDYTFLSDSAGSYLNAQAKGLPSELPPLAPNVTYTEQFKLKSLNSSILATPLNISSFRSFHDPVLCTSFTQVIVLDPTHPYVIGTRMEGDGLTISKIETLVTDEGDWLFNATAYAMYDSMEDWSPIPDPQRDSRELIKAAGDAYFNRFANANITVPWGTPCSRLEGGAMYTGMRNISANECNLGIPSNVRVVDRRYVIDEIYGVVNIFLGFPGLDGGSSEPAPDSHTFRVVNGKLRYIHTLSTCEGHPGCKANSTVVPNTKMPMLHKIRRSWNETSGNATFGIFKR